MGWLLACLWMLYIPLGHRKDILTTQLLLSCKGLVQLIPQATPHNPAGLQIPSQAFHSDSCNRKRKMTVKAKQQTHLGPKCHTSGIFLSLRPGKEVMTHG